MMIKITAGLAFLVMIAVNFLANTLPINGITTGEVSDYYPNLFAPAGLTFSVWGLIYISLAAYTLYQFGLFQKDKGVKRGGLFNKIGVYFITTSVANAFWIFAWHYRFIGVTVLLMSVILYCLIKIADLISKEKLNRKERLFISTPFGVYFGWITVATIANVVTFLVSINWRGFGITDDIWTVIILLTGIAIVLARFFKDKNTAYAWVVIWAYLGILIKHTSPGGFAGQYPNIITVLIICTFLLLAAAGHLLTKGQTIKPKA
jgi:hypothetical protein